jgi:hypothetical protein
MAASRKKRTKRRAKVPAKTTKRTGAAPPGLTALDAGWRSFIEQAAEDKPLTERWPDPKAIASRPRKATAPKKAPKKAAKTKPAAKAKKSAKKKTPAKKKKAAKK